MPIDYNALKSDILSGPQSSQFAPLVAAGNDGGIAAAYNAPGSYTVTVSSLSRNDFLLGIAPAYLAIPGLSSSLQTKWDRILNVLTGADRVDFTNQQVQGLLSSAVADGVLTQSQANALSQRPGSRAESLFGAGVTVTQSDISYALRGTR